MVFAYREANMKKLLLVIFLFILTTPSFAAITFRAAETAASLSANTVTVTKPTGTVDNDIMLAIAYVNDATATITPPAGWTLAESVNTTITAKATLYYKKASSEGANYQFDFSVTSRVRATIVTFTGQDTTTPVGDTSGQGNSSSTSAPAATVTSTVDNSVIVYGAIMDSGTGTSWTPPTDYTEATDTGGAASTTFAYATMASAGATGTITGTNSSAEANAAYLVVLNLTAPAATGASSIGTGVWNDTVFK
jgi:hypothetical protein